MGRTPSLNRKVNISATIAPDIIYNTQQLIGTDKRWQSQSECIEDALRILHCVQGIVDAKDPQQALTDFTTKTIVQSFHSFMESPDGKQMFDDLVAVNLGVHHILEEDKRADAARKTRGTPVPTYSYASVDSVEPVIQTPIEQKHETTARTPQQAKEERANEIRRNFPFLLITYIRTKDDDSGKKVIEKKLLSDLERLWRYIDEPHRDDFISELNDHLLVFCKLNDKLVGETNLQLETLRSTLERLVRNDPAFSPRRTPVVEILTLPDEMAQRIKLERA